MESLEQMSREPGTSRKRSGGVLLIHAPTLDTVTLFRGAPMGILYAASVLAERIDKGEYPGWARDSLYLFDTVSSYSTDPGFALEELNCILPQRQPDIVAIGSTSYAFFWAIAIAECVKRWNPECPVIIGGPHEDETGAKGPGGSITAHAGAFDFSVQGDGEYLFERLVSVLFKRNFDIGLAKNRLVTAGSLANVEGQCQLTFSLEGNLVEQAPSGRFRAGLRQPGQRPLILDKLPSPPRWLLPGDVERHFSVFRYADGTPKRVAQIMAMRGCEYSCSFCTERGSLSVRSPHRILEELHTLRDRGYEAAFFDDSTFHLYHQLPDLLGLLSADRLSREMEMGFLTRVDNVLKGESRTPLNLFQEAGFSYFYLGIEHLDDAVLEEMRKGYTVDQIHSCFDLIGRTKGMKTGVSLLFGLRSESEASRYDSLRFVAERDEIVLVSMSILAYHPAAAYDKHHARQLAFDVQAPNLEPEWYLFEEGPWYHPENIGIDYVRRFHALVHRVDRDTRGKLIPKLQRKSQLRPVMDSGAISRNSRAAAAPASSLASHPSLPMPQARRLGAERGRR
ncbi:MAG TPA: B12-binding domain-containing radical SAM protein [Rhizomicrobium sp.]|nr:B12-binding domain-containing radical SAM protein [Rhizomicrobium sp.]